MKFPTKLNELDIIDLLNEYHSELRKMKQKMAFVKVKISDLEAQLENVRAKSKRTKPDNHAEVDYDEVDEASVAPALPKTPGKRGRKPKIVTAADEVAPKPEKKQRRQRNLSNWDNMLIDSLRQKGRALSSGDLFTEFETKVREAGISESEEKLRFKLNQILVKLSNKRNLLAKVAYPGRGFAYALPEWLNEKGKLLKEFMFEKEKKAKKPGRNKKAAPKKVEVATTGKRRGRKPKSAQATPPIE
jgi:hypothetical protein